MARPKEQTPSWNSALEERCVREQERLQQRLSKQLKTDFKRLLDDELEVDVTLTVDTHVQHAHSSIISSRCPELWQALSLRGGSAVLQSACVSVDEVRQIFRYIYSEDDLSTVSDIKDKLIHALHTKHHENEDPDVMEAFQMCNIQDSATTSYSDDEKLTKEHCSSITPQGGGTYASQRVPADPPHDVNDRQDGAGGHRGSIDDRHINGVNRPDETIGDQSEMKKGDRAYRASEPLNNGLDNGERHRGDGAESVNGGSGSRACDAQVDVQRCCDEDWWKQWTCCQVGEDLLQMFYWEQGKDVVLKVKDNEFRVHRCVLCARSTYFAAMLCGAWKESAARTIKLEGVSSEAMEQALRYMYGGVYTLHQTASLLELVTIADMYGMEGLKDIVGYELKKKCHFFHKPCVECVPEVVSILPTAYTFGLDDVWEKGLRWCSRYFTRVWTAKHFASLPQDLLDRCLEQTIGDITTESVIDLVLDCDKLMGSITNVRWSEPVVAMASKLKEACIDHLKRNFVQILQTTKFTSLGKTMALGLSFLGDIFARAIMTMPTDKACVTYAAVDSMRVYCQSDDCEWTDDFKSLVQILAEKCEHFMRLFINQLINTADWNTILSKELQDKIREGAWYVCVGENRTMKTPPKLFRTQRPISGRTNVPRSARSSGNSAKGKTMSSKKSSTESHSVTFRPVSRNQSGVNQSVHVHDLSVVNPKSVPGWRTNPRVSQVTNSSLESIENDAGAACSGRTSGSAELRRNQQQQPERKKTQGLKRSQSQRTPSKARVTASTQGQAPADKQRSSKDEAQNTAKKLQRPPPSRPPTKKQKSDLSPRDAAGATCRSPKTALKKGSSKDSETTLMKSKSDFQTSHMSQTSVARPSTDGWVLDLRKATEPIQFTGGTPTRRGRAVTTKLSPRSPVKGSHLPVRISEIPFGSGCGTEYRSTMSLPSNTGAVASSSILSLDASSSELAFGSPSRSIASNAATFNTSLPTPGSEFGGSEFSSSTLPSDVFSSSDNEALSGLRERTNSSPDDTQLLLLAEREPLVFVEAPLWPLLHWSFCRPPSRTSSSSISPDPGADP